MYNAYMYRLHRKHYYIYIYSANITAMQLCLYVLPLFGPIISSEFESEFVLTLNLAPLVVS